MPSIPSLEIYARPSGLDVLLKTYKEQLPALGGPITNGSVINMDRLKRMLTKLAEDEEDAFKRLSVSSTVTLFGVTTGRGDYTKVTSNSLNIQIYIYPYMSVCTVTCNLAESALYAVTS